MNLTTLPYRTIVGTAIFMIAVLSFAGCAFDKLRLSIDHGALKAPSDATHMTNQDGTSGG